MNVTYELFVYSDDASAPAAREFLEKYADYRRRDASVYSFNEEATAREAVRFAEQREFEAQLFYIVQLAPEEIAAHPGFYFSLEVEEELTSDGRLRGRHLKEVDVAEDLETDAILVDAKMRAWLEQHAVGVVTAPLGEARGREWWRIAALPVLPDPIYLPRPVSVARNEFPPDTFAVQSDGRDVLSARNADWLASHGLSVSHEAQTSEGRMKWRPRVVASGRLMTLLRRDALRGVSDALVPLLPAGHPLSHD